METNQIPVRYHYHLFLSRRRGFNLTPEQYQRLKNIGLIIDLKKRLVVEGKYKVLRHEARLNNGLFNLCTAAELHTDNFGNKEVIILVLKEFQNYVHPDVAHQLRSRLGDMIQKYGKVA